MNPKVLALLFSGRKNGNSSIMMNEIMKPIIEAGIDSEVVNAALLDIKPCVGCFGCNNGEFKCVLKDGLDDLKNKIAAADMLILVSPCYIFGPPAIMKNILDRSAAWALDRIENNDKKKIGISVSFAGAHGEWCSMQKTTSSLFLKLYNCDVRVQRVYEYTALKGEILLQPSILQEGKRIGEAAVKCLSSDDADFPCDQSEARLTCSGCKSDVFRITDSTYTCAVCGATFRKTITGIKNEPCLLKFTPKGAAEHSEFIGGKILNGFAMSEEISKRLEAYTAHGIVPQTPYSPPRLPEDAESAIEWDPEGLAEFERAVPKGFQKFVKKAVERKALDQGIERITKEAFLKIKKASGN